METISEDTIRRNLHLMPKPAEPTAGYRFFHTINVLLRIVIVLLILLLIFRIQKVDVTGSERITEEQVMKWLSEDKKTLNSLYAVWKYNIRKQSLSPAVEQTRVSIKLPWHIRLKVKEWPPAGMIETEDAHYVFNSEGMVIATAPIENYGMLVTGVTPVSGSLFHKLTFEEGDMMTQILVLKEYLDANDLEPDEASWKGDDYGWQLRFGATYARLGTAITEDKIRELATLYPEVEDKTGIIHLESYEAGDEIVRFEQIW